MEPCVDFTAEEIAAAQARLAPHLLRTPVLPLHSQRLAAMLPTGTEVTLKLELFQRTGSFKPRGALTNVLLLPPEALARGITAVSAGNHAIAAAFAAQVTGTSAKVIMIQTANALRIARSREFGAEVLIAGTAHQAFAQAEEIVRREGRSMIHPFEGRNTALGTATLGAEFLQQAPYLDAVIVPIGGGGLCAGVAAAFKLLRPQCRVYAVEPEGADSMRRSFAAGSPQSIEKVATIADSLGAPYALPITFGLCRRFVDDLVLVSDAQIRAAMRTLLEEALATHRKSVRATILLGDLHAAAGDLESAIEAWKRIDQQNPVYIALVATKLMEAYRKLGRSEQGLQLLRGYLEQHPSLDLLDAAFQWALEDESPEAAYQLVRDELRRNPTLLGLDKLLEAQILVAPPERRADLELVKNLIHNHTRKVARYRCDSCGFKARQFYWRCPGCGAWESYPPKRTEEFDLMP